MTLTEIAKQITNKEEGPRPAPSVLPAPFAKEDDVAKIGPKEAALRAARDEDLTIPAALARTKGMSKADFEKLHEQLSKKPVKGKAKLKIVPPVKPSTLTEADKKAIAELKKAEKLKAKEKKAAGLAKLKAARVEKKAVREAAKEAAAVRGEAAGALKSPKAPKAAKTAKPTSEPRKGSKTALIGELLSRKEGCTTADVLKATGWPAVSMPQQAKALGVGLRKEKQGNITRYWAD